MPEDQSRSPSRAEVNQTAIDLAVKAARSEERVLARLDAHDDDIRELRQGQAATTATLDTMKGTLNRVETSMASQAAAAAAIAEAAKNTLTARQFWLGVFSLCVVCAGIILGAHGA